MMQATEYQPGLYLKWLWRTTNFTSVMNRRELVITKPTKALLWVLRLGMLLQIIFGIWLEKRALNSGLVVEEILSAVFILSTPIVWAYLIMVPVVLGRWLVIKPYYRREIKLASNIFAKSPAAKIAIAGSYGKTTMKEILLTVLGAGQKVVATPGNRNVAISHSQFAKSLKGDEEILIIEYGEGAPGDVACFARITHPNMGIITGLAPAHLDKYKTLEAAGKDIFSLADYLGDQDVYVNGESAELKSYIKSSHIVFDSKKVAGWKITNIKTDIDGLKFTMKKKSTALVLSCDLIGQHLVAPVALAAYFAYESGMTKGQIEKAVAQIKPFEHRMKPYQLSGAWIIDDTYNGNIEGMRAGLDLLKQLPAKRKIYVTPGLVDQGSQEQAVHEELGRLITSANPDQVILMDHSVTGYIQEGLKDYKGKVTIEDDPLNFYTHLDKYVAEGDLVLMQNDWPDNYV